MTGDEDNPFYVAYLSTDNGANWKQLDLSSYLTIYFRNTSNDIYVACYGNGIYNLQITVTVGYQ